MKRTGILIAALTGVLLAAQAQAQAPGQGLYLGVGYGSVWSNGGSVYDDTLNENTVAGGKIYGGRMWNSNWGMEFAYQALGSYDTKFAGIKLSDMETTAVSVAGVHTTPLGAGFDFNARLGLAFTNAKYTCVSSCGTGTTPGLLNVSTEKRGVSGLIGLGVGMRMSENFGLRIDFDHFGGVHHRVDLTEYKEGYDVMSINLQLLF